MPTNADGTMGFKQNSDLFYLTGIDQEDSILLIFPDNHKDELKEILFVRETNEHIKTWEGEKLSKEKASEISGIENVRWEKDFNAVFRSLVVDAEFIYLNTNEHLRSDTEVKDKDWSFIQSCKENYPLHKYERSAPILRKQRTIKSEFEIAQIKKAIEITDKTFRRVLKFAKPNRFEYEIEAEIQHEFLMNQSRGPAFQTIVASGADSCVLHYISNNKELKDGEHLLLDFGAEYANYNADITRCIPIGGKFSPRVREVYESVLSVLKATTENMTVGKDLDTLAKETGVLMEKELLKLGLLKQEDIDKQTEKSPAYKKYFMHGVSHFLGLDVHDVGNRNHIFDEGMILTCEPGIYIPEEKIGIRLENDILISSNGPINLSNQIPIEIDDIEELMKM